MSDDGLYLSYLDLREQQVSGSVGSYITKSLLAGGKHKVTAITRADGKSPIPDGVTAKKVNYDDQSSLVAALKGQEVLIITMGVMAPPDTQAKLVDAAAAAGVSWILPNEWGFDHNVSIEGPLGGLSAKSKAIRERIDSLAPLSYIGVTCGFWYEFSLSGSPYRYGFDFNNKSVVFFDEGTTKINTSTWPQCGRAVANLLSLKILPEDESDKSPTLSQFRNDFIRISNERPFP